jgi:DNA-binding transcriptional ArsR family regulator
MTNTEPFDICGRKNGGNEQSRVANQKNSKGRVEQRLRVMELIKDSPDGLSMKEVARAMDVEFCTVSGRGTDLKRMGLVEPSGEIREGSAVLVPASKLFAKPQEAVSVKGLSPVQTDKELASLQSLYEQTELTSVQYDAAKRRIWAGLEAWFGEVEVEQ